MDARVKTDSMMAATQGRPEFSVVSPVRNEADNVEALVREIADGAGRPRLRDHLRRRRLAGRHARPPVRPEGRGSPAARHRPPQERRPEPGRPHRRRWPRARNVIVTLDGDGQNDPADIPGLLGQLNRADAPEDLALIQGRRAEADRFRLEEDGLAPRQPRPAVDPEGQEFRFGLRHAGLPARRLPAASLFRSHAPLPAGPDDVGGTDGRRTAGRAPGAPAWAVELHQFRPAGGRGFRHARRHVAAQAAAIARRGRTKSEHRGAAAGRNGRRAFNWTTKLATGLRVDAMERRGTSAFQAGRATEGITHARHLRDFPAARHSGHHLQPDGVHAGGGVDANGVSAIAMHAGRSRPTARRSSAPGASPAATS